MADCEKGERDQLEHKNLGYHVLGPLGGGQGKMSRKVTVALWFCGLCWLGAPLGR